MRKLWSFLSEATEVVFAVAIVILALPFILVVVIGFGSVELYEKLWTKLRHDPKPDLTVPELGDESWPEADTREQFVAAFEAACTVIAQYAHAKQSSTEYKGFEVFDTEPDDICSSLSLRRTLHTKHAEVVCTFMFDGIKDEKSGRIVPMIDDDEQCGTLAPPLRVEITKPPLHTKRTIILDSYNAAWVVISLLRGDARFTTQDGQLWAHIPEHNTWIVQYQPNNSSYGYRAEFTNAYARKYGHDRTATYPTA